MVLMLLPAGFVIGGVLGMLIGLGAMAIPGLGPMVAAGTLATMLGTMCIGALMGAFFGIFVGFMIGTGANVSTRMEER
jgi:hypothetical protein